MSRPKRRCFPEDHHEAVSVVAVEADISHYASMEGHKELTADKKFQLLTSCFKPDVDYNFPPREEFGKKRKFQHAWLRQYTWLVYGPLKNGGFCINCLLFGQGIEGELVSRAQTCFTKSKTKLSHHDNQESHKLATTKASDFLDVMKGKREDIQSQMNHALVSRVIENRLKLESIIKTIIFCGRQNISLRGHRDNTRDAASDERQTANHGNLISVWRLETVFWGCTSAQLPKIGEQICDHILQKMKKNKFFSIIADEVTDSACKEQLSMVLRDVDPDDYVREDLVDFLECDTGITSVRNMMGTVDRISTFMEGHPKRAYAFEAAVLETQLESRKHKLKNLCCTRWVERLDALATFVELHPTVVACLEKIVEDGPAIWSTDSLTDAQTLLLAITSTDFIVSLVITNNALGYLKGVTTSLQAEAKDIVEAISEVNYLKAALQDVRNNMDDH
ncbi:52 kDa repressor of the inhibitor of the protein kinase-like 11, partial [Homarus americanus]